MRSAFSSVSELAGTNRLGPKVTQQVAPYVYRGGQVSDYAVEIGDAGTYATRHIPSGQAIQSVVPGLAEAAIQSVVPGLAEASIQLAGGPMGWASLALNAANLGVGVYNTYQLSQANKNVAQMKMAISAGFSMVNHTLDAHSRVLAVLRDGQSQIGKDLDAIRQDLHSGFSAVLREVRNQEARRLGVEYREHTALVVRAMHDFVEAPREEAPLLRERADALLGWLDSRQVDVLKGSPDRLPLAVARVLAMRARADAFLAMGRDEKGIASVERAIDMIRDEAQAFCDGRTLYGLAVDGFEVLAQYYALLIGLENGRQPESGTHVEAHEALWDDGLATLRAMVSPTNRSAKPRSEHLSAVPLRTIQDVKWYCEFSGEDPVSFDIRTISQVEATSIFAAVGLPPDQDVLPNPTDLMTFALPTMRDAYSNGLAEAFGFATKPRIATASVDLWSHEATPLPKVQASSEASDWGWEWRAQFRPKTAERFEFVLNGIKQELWIDPPSGRVVLKPVSGAFIRGRLHASIEDATFEDQRYNRIFVIKEWMSVGGYTLPDWTHVLVTYGKMQVRVHVQYGEEGVMVTGHRL